MRIKAVPTKRLFKLNEAAKYLSLSYPSMKALVETGRLPGKRLGKFCMIKVEDLEMFVASLDDYQPLGDHNRADGRISKT